MQELWTCHAPPNQPHPPRTQPQKSLATTPNTIEGLKSHPGGPPLWDPRALFWDPEPPNIHHRTIAESSFTQAARSALQFPARWGSKFCWLCTSPRNQSLRHSTASLFTLSAFLILDFTKQKVEYWSLNNFAVLLFKPRLLCLLGAERR